VKRSAAKNGVRLPLYKQPSWPTRVHVA
jgi:hypothetical protein